MSRFADARNPVAQEQVRRNFETRYAWKQYASHRREVCRRLIKGRTRPAGGLCILGAGNCNDLDLPTIAKAFQDIVLVDLDPAAVHWGISHQHAEDLAIRVASPVDLSGIADVITPWRKSQPDDDTVAACISRARAFPTPSLNGQFDCVVSLCLLTQLIDAVVQSLDVRHSLFGELVLAVRNRHLRLLLDLAKAGGTVILITDVVSSVTCPELVSVAPSNLRRLLVRLLDQRNFFTGTNPFAIRQACLTSPELAGAIQTMHLSAPWKWDFGSRVYAVVAVQMRRT